MDNKVIQFDYLYFLDEDDGLISFLGKKGSRIYKISKPRISISFINEILVFAKKNAKEYDIVHNHEVYLTTFFSTLFKHYGTSTFISHSHTTRLSPKLLSKIRNSILCLFVSNHSDYQFACSDAAGHSLFKNKWNSNKSFIIPNAIRINKFQFNESTRNEYRKELGLTESLVIGNTGRLEPGKNQIRLIEIFKEILSLRPDSKLLLIGEGNELERIKEFINKNDLKDSIRLLGKRKDVNNLYQAMDIYIFTSIYEGLGITLIEAQCSGLPCIASTGVPKETAINSNILYCDLKQSNKYWANLALANTTRANNSINQQRLSRYDIDVAGKELFKLYKMISDKVDLKVIQNECLFSLSSSNKPS